YQDGAPIRIADVGEAIDSLENDLVQVMYGGPDIPMKPGYICIAATKSQGANAVALSQRIRDLLDEIEPTLPGSLEVDVFYDRAIQIKSSVDDVKQTIVIALILVIMVIFLFLGRLSDTMIPSMVLPVTLFGTFLVMMLVGFSLDNLSLMALTLSIGFLVDDAIVVLENTVRYVQAGKKPLEAAIVSMEEISGTVVSTSLALITVFIPLVFMGGVIGKNFQEFALVVIIAIAMSTLMALTLSPMMCARILKGGSEESKPWLERTVERVFKQVVDRYGAMLSWFLHRKYLAILGWVACLVGIGFFFSSLPKSFMPIGDSGTFYGQMVALQGTSTDQIRYFQDRVNSIINSHPEIERLLTVTGSNPGADQSTGMVVGTLKEDRDLTTIEMVQVLTREMQEISNLGQVYIMPMPSLILAAGAESTATGSKYSYVLSGQDKDDVYQASFKLVEEMEKTGQFSGIQNSVKLNMPQLNVELRRDRASALG
ncbi:MAG TPA: efflux RND transporter permease subunit, partial [bacterium]|nr:efflux RND transporter permease subunit [bacterium]